MRKTKLTVLAALLLIALPFVPLSSSLDIPLIVTTGADGIVSIAGYSISIAPKIIPEANTTFSDVIHLSCPVTYQDVIGIHNVSLNANQIYDFTIFVNYTQQKIVLYQYHGGTILQNQTFTLNPGTSAIMGLSITTTVTQAGPINSITFDIVTSATAFGAHDVAVTNLTNMMYQYPKTAANLTVGQRANLTATAANHGTTPETFNVSFYYGTQFLGNITITNLQPSTQVNVTYVWDTVAVGVAGDNMTVTAKANIVPGETNTADNTFTDGWIKLWLPGDGNHDGRVNYKDLGALAIAYGSKLGDGSGRYNPDYDFNSDGRINYMDLGKLAVNYGLKL